MEKDIVLISAPGARAQPVLNIRALFPCTHMKKHPGNAGVFCSAFVDIYDMVSFFYHGKNIPQGNPH